MTTPLTDEQLRAQAARVRLLYKAEPAPEDDTRPPVNFFDPESMKRWDLTREERAIVKECTFGQRYGMEQTEQALDRLQRGRLHPSPEQAQAMVQAYWDTEGRTPTGRDLTPPEPQRLLLPGEDVESITERIQALTKDLDPNAPTVVLDSLANVDYSATEKRVMAYLLDELGVKAEDAPYSPQDSGKDMVQNIRNSMVQAEATADMMATTLATLKAKLDSLVTKYGLIVTDPGDGSLGIAFPEGMPLETQMEVARELGGSPEGESPSSHTYTLHSNPAEPVPDLRGALGRPARVGQIGRPHRAGMLMAALGGMLGTHMDDVLSGGSMHPTRYTPSTPAPMEPADRRKGEIGRVSPDLAYKLRQAGFNVTPGDMLVWHVEGVPPSWRGIFALRDGQIQGPEIPLGVLPHKIQKRAVAAKPVIS